MIFFSPFEVRKTNFLFFHKENGKYLEVILNKSRLILMSSNYTTSSYTRFGPLLFPYHLFTKNKNSKRFCKFYMFPKECMRG